MTREKFIAELESLYNNATGIEVIVLIFFFSLVIAGLFLLIHYIWTGITFGVEFGLDIFWKWKNSDVKDYSQKRYNAFKKKQFKQWKNKTNENLE